LAISLPKKLLHIVMPDPAETKTAIQPELDFLSVVQQHSGLISHLIPDA
jgi:hypothetical protein